MKTNLYAIYDTAAGIYMKPWQALTDDQAMREFSDIVAMPDSAIGKHPEDYSLSKVGNYNDGNAHIDNYENITLLTGLETVALINRTAQAVFEKTDPQKINGEQAEPGHLGE